MKRFTIIRGLPGSGKSTLANALRGENTRHFETDHYFLVGDEYRFNPANIGAAHRWCYLSSQLACESGKNVIVSNVFTKLTDILPYAMLAVQHGYTLQVITCEGKFGNRHNVPEDVIEKMKAEFEQVSCDELLEAATRFNNLLH
jgi:predicted ABC-type ATPase